MNRIINPMTYSPLLHFKKYGEKSDAELAIIHLFINVFTNERHALTAMGQFHYSLTSG